MNIELWFAFVATSAALLAIPGPVVMVLFGYTMGYGRAIAVAAIPGVVLGDFVAMTISLLGAGAILQASATIFMGLKLVGAAYLVWLGVQIWRSDVKPVAVGEVPTGQRKLAVFRDTFLVTALNPKDIVFFVAFLPQFIVTEHPALPQILIIEATFLGLVVISTTTWILLSGTFISRLKDTRKLKFVNRIGASCLVGAGSLTALSR